MIRHAFVSLAALPALIGVAGSTSVPGGAGTSEFAAQLDRLPAALFTPETGAIVQYVDMIEVWKRLGVGADPDERLANLGRTILDETYGQSPQLFGANSGDVEGANAEVGFSIVDIEREAALLAPPRQVIVVETSVSPEAVAAAVETDPLWSDLLTEQHGPDGDYWQWGEDPTATEFDRLSPMRSLGRGGVLALLPDEDPATVVRSIEAADLESAQRAMAGSESSLLDAGPIAEAAAVLGDSTVIQALGTTDPILVAEVVDGEITTTQILVPQESADAAAAFATSAEAFLAGNDVVTGAPVSEILPGATVDIVGNVVRVTVPGPGTYRRAVSMLMQRALFPPQ